MKLGKILLVLIVLKKCFLKITLLKNSSVNNFYNLNTLNENQVIIYENYVYLND